MAAEPVVDRDPSPRAVVGPPAAPVWTVPEHQILVKPQGAPDTGDGSTAPADPTPESVLTAGLGAAAALGALYLVGRRSPRRSPRRSR